MLYKKTWLEKVIFLKRKGGGGGTPAHEATSYTGSFFTDMVAPLKKLLVSFMPKQDLHGYDKPWAGGSGKNCIDIDALFVAPQGTLYSGDTPYTFPHVLELALTPNTTYTVSSDYTIANKQRIVYVDTATAVDAVYKANSVVKTTGSDGVLKIGFFDNRTGSEDFLNKTVYLQVEEGSTATSYEPYSNICPISGHTDVETEVCGVNLLDPQSITVGKFYNNTLTEVTNADKAHSDFIKIKPSTSYYLNGFAGQSFYSMLALDENKQPITTWYSGASKTAPFVATTPSNARYMMLNFNADQVGTIAFYESTTTDGYIPYQGTTYTTTLGRTVYGGTLDVVSGVLTADRAMVDLGTLTWQKYSVTTGTLFRSAQINDASLVHGSTNFICSNYATTIPSTRANRTASCSNNKRVDIIDNSFADATESDFKTAMNGVQLVYELSTPQTYQLDPQQINSLIGQNNIITEDGVEVSEVVYMTHLVGGPLLGGSTSSPNSEDESEEPVEEIEESGE